MNPDNYIIECQSVLFWQRLIDWIVQVNVNVKTISVSCSRLNGTYVLEQFHFHWGVNNINGSEHSVDGMFYPFEVCRVSSVLWLTDILWCACQLDGVCLFGDTHVNNICQRVIGLQTNICSFTLICKMLQFVNILQERMYRWNCKPSMPTGNQEAS